MKASSQNGSTPFFYLRYTSDEYKKHDYLAFIFILLTVFLFATCNSEDEGENTGTQQTQKNNQSNAQNHSGYLYFIHIRIREIFYQTFYPRYKQHPSTLISFFYMRKKESTFTHRAFALACVLCIPSGLFAQEDLVVYRNGEERQVRLLMVSSDEVTYSLSAKGGPVLKDKLKDVYMLKYSKRGNVYITEDCKRITGENNKIGKDANIIYLVKGGEIIAYDLQIQENTLVYSSRPRSKSIFAKKEPEVTMQSIDLHDVFFIRYKDGTKDLINDISPEHKEAEEKARIEAEEKARAEEELKKINETKVIFHNVKKGETLAMIAKRYNVSWYDIITWNDLPKSSKQNVRLKPDMQLMIYIKNANL